MRAKRNNKFTKAPQDFVDTKIVGIDWCRGKTSPRGSSPRARRRAATAEHQQVPLRETLWTIDGVALVVATALLTMKYQRLGNDCVAAGF